MNPHWQNDPRFQKITGDKRALIFSFIQHSKNLPKEQLPSMFLRLNNELSGKNLSLTESEKKILSEIMLDQLSIPEKERFKKILQMIKSF